MALSRKGKIWLILLSIPVIVVIAGAIALKMLFTSDRLKSFIIPQLEEATHRTVSVDHINLSLLPTLAVEIDGLSISNKKEPGFSERPMVQLDRLVLEVKLFALIKGNVEVTTVTLDHPQLFFEVNEKGLANYSEQEAPAAKEEAVKPSTGGKGGGFGLLLSNLQVMNGSVEYVDRKGKSATTLEGIHQQMRVAVPQGKGEVVIEIEGSVDKFTYGSLNAALVSNLKLQLKQAMTYDIQRDVLTFSPGTAMVEAIPLTVRGEVTECTKLPVMNLIVESDNVSIPEMLSLMPKEYMKKAEGVKGTGVAKVKLEVKGSVTDSTNPDITGMVEATNATIQYPRLPKAITNINLVSDFTRARSKQEFKVTKFSATLGNNPIGATMTVVNFDDPSLTMSVNASMNLAEVKDYYPLEAGTELRGMMKAKVDLAGKVSNPAAMKAAGNMEFQNVTIKTPASTKPVENLNGTITFNNQRIDAKNISLTLGKSDLAMTFSMTNYLSLMSDDKKAPKATANLTLTSNRLFTSDIIGEENTGPSQPTATAGQQTGKQKNAPARSGIMPLPNVDLDVAATIGSLTMEKFQLSNVRSTMKISNGIIHLQNFTCNTFDGSIATKGTLNMQNPSRPTFDLAFDMNAVNAHSLLPNFTSFGERLFGKLSMSTTLSGALDDTLGIVKQGLTGQGKVGVQEGKLTGLKVNQVIASMLKLPDVEEVSFKDWTNAFSISDGRINIKDLKIGALGADYVLNGSQGLDGSLDYTMSMILSENTSAKVSIPGFAGEAVKLFKEPNGRVKLDFTIGGTSDDPKVNLDTKPAQRKAEEMAKQKLSEESKKLEDQAKKKAGDLLKDLLKKK